MAFCRDLETTFCDRGNDRPFCGNGAWHCLYHCRRDCQLDDRGGHCGNSAGVGWFAFAAARNILELQTPSADLCEICGWSFIKAYPLWDADSFWGAEPACGLRRMRALCERGESERKEKLR